MKMSDKCVNASIVGLGFLIIVSFLSLIIFNKDMGSFVKNKLDYFSDHFATVSIERAVKTDPKSYSFYIDNRSLGGPIRFYYIVKNANGSFTGSYKNIDSDSVEYVSDEFPPEQNKINVGTDPVQMSDDNTIPAKSAKIVWFRDNTRPHDASNDEITIINNSKGVFDVHNGTSGFLINTQVFPDSVEGY